MGLYLQNTVQAERDRGCVLSLRFRDAASVFRERGAITGNPTFVDDGIVLDGTNDYLTYSLTGREITNAGNTVVMEFWPEFDYDEDAIRYLYTSNTPNILYVAKRDTASSHVLRIVAGGVAVADIASSVYGPYWKVNQRNVLVVRTLTSDTSVWLNGAEILSNNTTAFSVPTTPVSMVVGARQDGVLLFKGKITAFKLFDQQLEAQEAIDFYNQSTWDYMDDAELILPMRAQDHDPTNVRTLDVTTGRHHATFGDGATPTTYPTKLARRGYSTDGGDYLKTGVVPVVAGQHITSVCQYRLGAITGSYGICQWSTDSSVNSFLLLHSGSADKLYYFVRTPNEPQAAILSGINGRGIANIIAVGRYDGINTSMWVDGKMATNAATPLAPIADSTAIMSLFIRPNIVSNPMPAGSEIYFAALWRKALTPLQIYDLTNRLMKEVRHV